MPEAQVIAPSPSPFQWYCATTLPFQELTAETNLRRQGFHPFNPKCETERVTRGREVLSRAPYIPGYIFINFDIDDDAWRKINSTRGIRQLIYGSHERPARIRQDAMQIILDKCNGQIVKLEEVDFALSKIVWPGAEVRVTDGPFAGFHGTVKWSKDDRAKVLMRLFGRDTPADLKTNQLEIVG